MQTKVFTYFKKTVEPLKSLISVSIGIVKKFNRGTLKAHLLSPCLAIATGALI